VYRVPGGALYPSVTNVLGVLPSPELEAWEASVGFEEAEKARDRGRRRGSAAHVAMESYVDGTLPDDHSFPTQQWLTTFEAFRTAADAHLSDVVAQELFLYSDALRMAGACDVVGRWDGVPSVVDYKTSGNHVYPEQVPKYWMQLTAYAIMLHERYGHAVKQLVIVMAVDHDEKPLIMRRPLDLDVARELLRARVLFKEKYGT
jgi:hypothetical protein